MVNICGTEVLGDARQQVCVFDSDARRSENPHLVTRRRPEPFGCNGKRLFPVNFTPLAAFFDSWRLQAIATVYRLIAETIAVGKPRLVNALVLFGHDTFEGAAQHMCVHVRANAVVW